MKVVIQNCCGVFMLSNNQLKYILENVSKEKDPILFWEVKDSLKYLEEHPREYKVGLNIQNEYKYRSHPLIVKAVEMMPLSSQSVVDIDGDVYRIVEMEDGSEYVETPCLEYFIKGFKQ